MSSLRVAVDIGGTFTDVCVMDETSGAIHNADIAVHVGTLHWTCKAAIRAFEGDMRPGDVYAINDPYAGGTHFPDVRLIRPVFVDGAPIAFAQSNGHWSDVDVCEYAVDEAAMAAERGRIRAARRGWVVEDPEAVARFRAGELNALDLVSTVMARRPR